MNGSMTHFQRTLAVSLLPMLAFLIGLISIWDRLRFSLEQQGGSLLGVGLICGGLLLLSGYWLFMLVKKDNTTRVLEAMNVCQANVMVADNQMNITYLNHPAHEMMRRNEAALRTAIPGFHAESLLGANVDIFHSNPAHQRRLIESLTTTYKTEIKVAGLAFGLVATPLFDSQRKRVGTVIEWYDRTEQNAQRDAQEKMAAENARIAAALKICDTNVMMADNDCSIIYMNDSITTMLRDVEPELRQHLPSFSMQTLMGQNIDVFHKNPSHQRNLLGHLTAPHRAQIKVGGLTFSLIATPIIDGKGARQGTVIEWKNLTEELRLAELEKIKNDDNLRVKRALDSVTNNTMIADKEGNIVYMNRAVSDMLKNAESDIRKALPHFNADKLVGANYDVFHKNPAHQRNLLGQLTGVYRAQINVGGRTFLLTANPIFNEERVRLGSVVEWADRTQEVAIEGEFNSVIQAANDGDLSRRVDLNNKQGFFLNLSTGINQLVEVAEGILSDAQRVMDALAHGRLNEKIAKDYRGTFGKLKQDTNATVDILVNIVEQITVSARAVASGAQEIAQGNTDLSQRTEEQASSLEETASSMEEMTSAVRQSGDNAKHANSLASEAREKAMRGGEMVSRAVNAMGAISASSKKIADIISVIDEIAFQTNLLALNAAVEAARAGEQGRGFAVVAGEVRSLAQRSAGAAKEIKDLIRDSVTKVQDGTQLVNESGETLKELVSAVQRVSSIVQEITTAAMEQTSGIEQVNVAVSQMDEMTQQNAALVEEASAAGEALSEQAQQLIDLIAFFDLGGKASERRAGATASLSGATNYNKPARVPAASPHNTSTARLSRAPARAKPTVVADEDDADDWQEF